MSVGKIRMLDGLVYTYCDKLFQASQAFKVSQEYTQERNNLTALNGNLMLGLKDKEKKSFL